VPPVRAWTTWRSDTAPSLARIAEAEAAKRDVVKTLFAEAGVAFPPALFLLRAFKKERRLEERGASRAGAPLTHITTYVRLSTTYHRRFPDRRPSCAV
jgi:hypothetical protein